MINSPYGGKARFYSPSEIAKLIAWGKENIEENVVFDTPYESGCRTIDSPNNQGDFMAYDSDNVPVSFSVRMIKQIHDSDCDCYSCR